MSGSRKKTRAVPSPKGFSAEARKLWRDLLTEYAIDDAAGLALLGRACEALDRMRQAQVVIRRRGIVVADKKGSIKSNPAVLIEKEAHRQLLESLKALNFDLEPLRDRAGRPGGRR